MNSRRNTLLFLAMLAGYSLQAQTYEQGFQTRKALLINQVCIVPNSQWGMNNVPDPEKHHWPKTIARIDKYGNADTAANFRIVRFKDRSPFHFTLVGMARIMGQYGTNDSLVKYRKTYLRNVWERQDSYNAFTGEGTENHTNMNRTSGYLYAQYSLGDIDFPQATARLADMKAWVLSFSKQLYKVGNGEWNSSVYEAYNLVGWLNLFDLATDPEVKNAAKAVLDYYAAEMGLHYTQGAVGGAEMRGNSVRSNANSYEYLAWLWFGTTSKDATASTFWIGKDYSQAVHAAVSAYRPPSIAVKLAQKNVASANYYTTSRPDYLLTTGAYIKQNFLIEKGYTLGAAYMPYGGWTNASFQLANWKMVGKVAQGANKDAEIMTGNGRYWNKSQGRWRNPFDQFVQHKNVMIQMTRLTSDTAAQTAAIAGFVTTWKNNWLRDFSLRFPPPNSFKQDGNPVSAPSTSLQPNAGYVSLPKTAVMTRVGNITFYQMESVFAAVRTIAQDSARRVQESDGNLNTRFQIEDKGDLDQLTGFVIEFANASDFGGNISQFIGAINSSSFFDKSQAQSTNSIVYKGLNNDTIRVKFRTGSTTDTWTEPVFDWGYGPTSQVINTHSATWLQPAIPAVARTHKIAEWSVNGQNYVTTGPAPIFSGPGLNMDSSVLEFADGNARYEIDYRGNAPIFRDYLVGTDAKQNAARDLQAVSIFPNPAKGYLQLTAASGQNSELQYEVADLNGRTMQKGAATGRIDIGKLPSGYYLLKLQLGDATVTKPFVKH